jgi:hypothetical protein
VGQRWVVDVCFVYMEFLRLADYISDMILKTGTQNRRPLAASINHGTLNVDLVYKSPFQVEDI